MYKEGQIISENEYFDFAVWNAKKENNFCCERINEKEFKIFSKKESKKEISEKRRCLYIIEKDPLTCQIQALRDEPQTEEILNEIKSLQEERKRVVEKIKNENPYPVE